jgi:hypothetical protein
MSDTTTVSPLRQRMIEDMAARQLNPHTQRSHIQSCKRFAAWLKRSPATPDEVRRFQLHLVESGTSICNRAGEVVRLRAGDIDVMSVPQSGDFHARSSNLQHRLPSRIYSFDDRN